MVSDASTAFPEGAFDPEINESTVKMPIVSYQLTSDTKESLSKLNDDIIRWKKESRIYPGSQE